MARAKERAPAALREWRITRDVNMYAEGSALVEAGATRVICTVSLEARVPPFLRGAGQGWLAAEYAMLPRATKQRTTRESARGRPSGRSQEIGRLIGRSLRSVCDLKALGERTFWIDCDVLQADGGTRTAAITGAYVALATALGTLGERVKFERFPLQALVAAVSVGLVGDEPRLDLDFAEDAAAQVDFNVVMTDRNEFVEVQGTAEGAPFARRELDTLLALAERGLAELFVLQRAALPAPILAQIAAAGRRARRADRVVRDE